MNIIDLEKRVAALERAHLGLRDAFVEHSHWQPRGCDDQPPGTLEILCGGCGDYHHALSGCAGPPGWSSRTLETGDCRGPARIDDPTVNPRWPERAYVSALNWAAREAGPSTGGWNLRYRQALAFLHLRICEQAELGTINRADYPDGIPYAAPFPLTGDEDGWGPHAAIVFCD